MGFLHTDLHTPSYLTVLPPWLASSNSTTTVEPPSPSVTLSLSPSTIPPPPASAHRQQRLLHNHDWRIHANDRCIHEHLNAGAPLLMICWKKTRRALILMICWKNCNLMLVGRCWWWKMCAKGSGGEED
ncbi:Asymmetric leaves1 and rough sheath [Forsythia ovata]|uniref:Asymmetric leaves1 and rough sheath n=1 Tax=Forsythia ovata TaxID=205694 RepID=A0ABD1XBQ0_9LAMI